MGKQGCWKTYPMRVRTQPNRGPPQLNSHMPHGLVDRTNAVMAVFLQFFTVGHKPDRWPKLHICTYSRSPNLQVFSIAFVHKAISTRASIPSREGKGGLEDRSTWIARRYPIMNHAVKAGWWPAHSHPNYIALSQRECSASAIDGIDLCAIQKSCHESREAKLDEAAKLLTKHTLQSKWVCASTHTAHLVTTGLSQWRAQAVFEVTGLLGKPQLCLSAPPTGAIDSFSLHESTCSQSGIFPDLSDPIESRTMIGARNHHERGDVSFNRTQIHHRDWN